MNIRNQIEFFIKKHELTIGDLLDINEAKQYKLIKEFEQKKISQEKFDNEINKLIEERKQILECN